MVLLLLGGAHEIAPERQLLAKLLLGGALALPEYLRPVPRVLVLDLLLRRSDLETRGGGLLEPVEDDAVCVQVRVPEGVLRARLERGTVLVYYGADLELVDTTPCADPYLAVRRILHCDLLLETQIREVLAVLFRLEDLRLLRHHLEAA